MEIVVKIAALGIITSICAMLLRERGEYSLLIGIVGGVAILLTVFDYFFDIFEFFTHLTEVTGLDNGIVTTVLKVVGIGYIVDFAADTATESGKVSLAKNIVFGGKVIIFCLIIPLFTELINIVVSMLD